MFLPIGDEPNPPQRPVMTLALIAANVAVYLLLSLPLSTRPVDPADPVLAEYLRALPPGSSIGPGMISAYDLVILRYGFRAASPSLIAVFTSMFLHAGLLHLAGNMLYLWIFGNNVEARLGRVGFLVWYLTCGVAALAFHAAFNLRSPVPLVGASGAISGVLGFYLVWFSNNVVKMWVFLFPFYIGVVRIRAMWVLVVYLLVDNLLPYLIAPQAGDVAHLAHIGGFFAGMTAGWMMRGRGRPV